MANQIDKLPNATVRLEGTHNTVTGTTDQDGNVILGKLVPDTYTMVVNKEGYEEYTYPQPIVITPDKLHNLTLNVTLSEKVDSSDTTRMLKIKLSPATTTDSQVTITNITDPENPIQCPIVFTPDENNIVVIKDVEFGSHSLKVVCDGYEDYIQNITVNKSNNNPRNISVTLVKKETEATVEPENESSEKSTDETQNTEETTKK